MILFAKNTANIGGAINWHVADVLFKGNSTVAFKKNNSTKGGGGAIRCHNYCRVLHQSNSKVKFSKNSARNDGAVHISNSKLLMTGSS